METSCADLFDKKLNAYTVITYSNINPGFLWKIR